MLTSRGRAPVARRLALAGATALGLVAGLQGPASAASRPLPALRILATQLTAGLALQVASASVRAQLSGDDYAWIPQSTCLTTAIDSDDATPCVLGDTTASTSVVLLGDSSADQWALDLGKVGSADGFRVVVYVHAACPVGQIQIKLYGAAVDPTCDEFRTDVLADLASMRPSPALVVVAELRLSNYVLAGGGLVSNKAWASALTTTLHTIVAKDGDAVLLLHGVPVTKADPGECIAANPTALGNCTTKRTAGDPSGYDAATWSGAHAAKAAGVDVTPLFCTSLACPAVADGEITHSGDNHVAEAYAAVAEPALAELLGCASVQSFAHDSRADAVLDAIRGHKTAALVKACKALAP